VFDFPLFICPACQARLCFRLQSHGTPHFPSPTDRPRETRVVLGLAWVEAHCEFAAKCARSLALVTGTRISIRDSTVTILTCTYLFPCTGLLSVLYFFSTSLSIGSEASFTSQLFSPSIQDPGLLSIPAYQINQYAPCPPVLPPPSYNQGKDITNSTFAFPRPNGARSHGGFSGWYCRVVEWGLGG
jgi:hypothetical protein